MTWPPSIAALERRAPWGSGASAMAHMMKPQIILLKARWSSRDLLTWSSQTRPIKLSFHEYMEATNKQRIPMNLPMNLPMISDDSMIWTVIQDGTDASQGKGQIISNINACQAVPNSDCCISHAALVAPCWSCCTSMISVYPCLSLNCGRPPLPRLWASWSPLWDLVVWTSW